MKIAKIFLFFFIPLVLFSQQVPNSTTLPLQYLGTWNSQGVPNYLEVVGDIIPNDLLNRIKATLPENKNLFVRKPQLIQDYQLKLTKQADVFVTFVGEEAGYRNVLGFYTYPVSNPPQNVSQITNYTVIFPNSSKINSGGGLKPGNKVKIGNFPANTVIAFFIIANGWSGSQITNGNWVLYSDSKFNPEANDTLKKHFIILNDSISGKIILSFEDIRNDNGSDKDFNDCIFYVSTNPTDATNIDSLPPTDPESKLYYTDIEINKVVNNNNPNNNDNIIFTVTAKNNGPDNATKVKITDILPAGLEYISSNASHGSYDFVAGVWNIGALAKNQTATLSITCKINLFQGGANFGPVSDFNLVVFGDINQPSADVEGKLAVQGNAYLDQYSVGYKLTHPAPKQEVVVPDVLIVGGNLIFLGGGVFGGNVVYGGTTNLPSIYVGIHDGELIRDTARFDFVAAKNHIVNLSNQLKNYKQNGTIKFQYGALTLTGKNPILNIFNINGDTLSEANTVNVNAPNGSVVVVNIKGKNVSWTGDHTVNGTAYGNVIYNFYEAEQLKISGIAVLGSIIAPDAELEFPAGVIKGQVFVKNMYGSGQFNWDPFVGNIPVATKIENTASLLNLGETDENNSNNSAKATLIVQEIEEPDVIPGNSSTTWQGIGQFTEDDIVWDMTATNDNKILSGTWGGNIYVFDKDGQNKQLLFSDTSVNFIWSLLVKDTIYYAAYEKGILYSTNKGNTWNFVNDNNIKNNDVRSLVNVDNKIYAAVWGKGVYVSTDMGNTWSQSGQIEVNAVQSLAKDSKNNIYAATFGGGIYKSTDMGMTWNQLDISYRHIWTLAVDANDNIFAGSFGNGVYYSSNEGANWTVLNNSLTGEYIYSLVIDDSSKIYASAWYNGIYQIVDPTSNSSVAMSLGLMGTGVTSLFYDGGYLYAANEKGSLLRVDLKKLVGNEVTNKDNKISGYYLAQNYPNPFNPTTKINYCIPENGLVTLKVYDISGKVVATLVNVYQNAGNYTVEFNAGNLSTGMYIYKLEFNNKILAKKMLLIK